MTWKLTSKYSKKTFNDEEYDCVNLCTVKINKTINNEGLEENYETETNNIQLFIKKDKNDNVCIFADNSLLKNINKIVNDINPMLMFAVQMFIPMFKPIECKFDMENLKLLELSFNGQEINIPENFSLTEKFNGFDSNFGNISSFNLLDGQLERQINSLRSNVNNDDNKNILDENEDETEIENEDETEIENEDENEDEDETETEDEDETEDENDKSTNSDTNYESDSEIISKNNDENHMENEELINLMTSMENMSNDENLKMLNRLIGLENTGMLEEIENISNFANLLNNNQNNTNKNDSNDKNVFDKIKEVWTNDYYDNENLDDFLVSDNNSEEDIEDNEEYENNSNLFSKYLQLDKDKICLEICLTNINNYENLKKYNDISRDFFEDMIMNDNLNLPAINKWIEKDDEGNKYLAYKMPMSSEIKTFKYEHLIQFKNIFFEFIEFTK